MQISSGHNQKKFADTYTKIIIIMYIYHALINALSAHLYSNMAATAGSGCIKFLIWHKDLQMDDCILQNARLL